MGDIKFSIFELDMDGNEYPTGKIFLVPKDASNYTVVVEMFRQAYNFSIGPNGFQCIWDKDQNGLDKTNISGKFHWPGPRLPACQIGGNWFAIKKVE